MFKACTYMTCHHKVKPGGKALNRRILRDLAKIDFMYEKLFLYTHVLPPTFGLRGQKVRRFFFTKCIIHLLNNTIFYNPLFILSDPSMLSNVEAVKNVNGPSLHESTFE